MKKKINKKTNKKVKSVVKTIARDTGSFFNKSGKKAVKTVKAFKKEWKKQQPQRERYLKDAKKIGGDVIETIKKDINEMQSRNKKR